MKNLYDISQVIRKGELIEWATFNKEADDTDSIITVLNSLYNTLKTDELRIIEFEGLNEVEYKAIADNVMCMPEPIYNTEGGGEFRVARLDNSNVVIFTPDLQHPGGGAIILK